MFDLAYGLVLAAAAKAGDRVQFEMLEGMANHQRRALLEQTRNLLLYAPACRQQEFLNAIGYLIRRLDENTGPENFLRHAFKLKVGSPEWEQLEKGFRDAFMVALSDAPRRTQDRLTERQEGPRAEMPWSQLRNEPDTDWSLPQNSRWAERIVARTRQREAEIPLVIDGAEVLPEPGAAGRCLDPSRPGVVLARFRQADEEESIARSPAPCVTSRAGGR